MAMLIDLHNHTDPSSDDSTLKVEELVRLAAERGLDGVVVSDHDYFWNTRKLTPQNEDDLVRLGDDHGILVVPGVEINTDDGHLICFGLKEYVFGMHHTSRVKEYIDEAEGAMLLAHPYRRQVLLDDSEEQGWVRSLERIRDKPIWALPDAVEVMNGRGFPDQNSFAQALAKDLGLQGLANSDAHAPNDVAVCATLFFDTIKNQRDLINAMKSGNFRPVHVNKQVPPEIKKAINSNQFKLAHDKRYIPLTWPDFIIE
jgi:predicted metal-dependent phosphoesterase TrpH